MLGTAGKPVEGIEWAVEAEVRQGRGGGSNKALYINVCYGGTETMQRADENFKMTLIFREIRKDNCAHKIKMGC